jgi:hypothetical protein
MAEWVRTGGTISDEELADRWSEVELRSEPDEDAEWDEDVAGMRPYVTIAELDGEEVARMRYLAPYDPASVPGSETSDETQADVDELACSRSEALGGKGVIVAGFSISGKAMVFDVEQREGEFELVPVGTVPITASPPPKILQRLNPLRASRRPRVGARPRERRARSSSAGGSRASPSSDPELDPPPAACWRRWLRRLFGGRA